MEKEEERLRRVYRTLASKNAIALLRELSKGLKIDDSALNRLNMNKRTAYYLLKEMKEEGLVIKKGSVYTLSLLGSFILGVQEEMHSFIRNEEAVTQLNELLFSSNVFTVTNELLKSLENIVGISNLEPIKIYTEWDQLVHSLVPRLKNARNSINLASRYLNSEVLWALLEAANRGVVVKILGNSSNQADRAKFYLAINLNEEVKKVAKFLYSLPNVQVRIAPLNYSYIVIDQEDVGIEVPSPLNDSFLFGVQFKSPVLAERMNRVYQEIFSKAQVDSVIISLLQEG